MGKYSKHNDIEAVMLKAEADLTNIEIEYKKCLVAQTVPDSLLVEVKDCLSNLRSALDYLWCKVPGVGSGAHFPVANSVKDFANKTTGVDQKNLAVVEKWQPYNGQEWVALFNILRNKHAHLTLVPQKRTETKEFSVSGKDGSSVRMKNCTFGGTGTVIIKVDGVSVPIDTRTQFPANTVGVDIKRTVWVDFLFDGSSISPDFPVGISALPFLKLSLTNVAQIISELEKV